MRLPTGSEINRSVAIVPSVVLREDNKLAHAVNSMPAQSFLAIHTVLNWSTKFLDV